MVYKETKSTLPIGVFDSGMGGLTVLSQLKQALPNESFIYLGDTARLPYGTKSEQTVVNYAMQMAAILVSKGIKLLVIACNTATMAALEPLRKHYPDLPIIGVIEPGAYAAFKATKQKSVLVLATEATVQSKVYTASLQQLDKQLKVTSKACGLFVALAEEGCINDDVANAVIKKYLALPTNIKQDCILLGCTHFPVLKSAIQAFVGDAVVIVDSAIETAKVVKQKLGALKLATTAKSKSCNYLVTDLPERFIRIGKIFLGHDIAMPHVEVVVPPQLQK